MNSFSLFLEIYKVILVVCFTRKYILVSLNLGIARNLEATGLLLIITELKM